MKRGILCLVVCFIAIGGKGQVTFSYTGAMQVYVVPAGITAISVDMQGAQGGGCGTGPGGAGGRTQATIPVVPGSNIYVCVGGSGGYVTVSEFMSGDAVATGGYGGGGGTEYDNVGGGGSGGGASDIRAGDSTFTSRLVIAAGGGGASLDIAGAPGGGLTGGSCGSSTLSGGLGATQSNGGVFSGSIATGGKGSGGGGGGGGYYGGGGGFDRGGTGAPGGGGGSSYADITATNVMMTTGYNSSGNGTVTISPAGFCTGSIEGGVALINPLSGNSDTTFTLKLTGETVASGLTYQWQTSANGSVGWINVTGATNASYTFSGIDTSAFFQCVITCPASGSMAVSGMAFVHIYPVCMCVPNVGQTTFHYTGTIQTYTVPKGVNAVTVDMQGGKGGGASLGPSYVSHGGPGGRAQGTYAVSAGEVIFVTVGGAGDTFTSNCWMCLGVGGQGGYGGGGFGGGGGGGASDVRLFGTNYANRILVAGGGGGAGCAAGLSNGNGGYGGGLSGGNGLYFGGYDSSACGQGGTQTAGGAGSYYNMYLDVIGGFGYGGIGEGDTIMAGGSPDIQGNGGGGGGGYYGGGGGGSAFWLRFGGGGGGSSYADPGMTNITLTPAYNYDGNGIVIITPNYECTNSVFAGTSICVPPGGSDTTTFQLSLLGATRDSGLTYQWQSALASTGPWTDIAGATNNTYVFTGTDLSTYFRCYIGCATGGSTDTSTLTYVQIYPAGVPVFSGITCKVYPNPAYNELMIEGASGCYMRVTNLLGDEIRQWYSFQSPEILDISGLPPGVFILSVTDSVTGTRCYKKFVKR